MTQEQRHRLEAARELAVTALLEERAGEGLWRGRLSSSAVSTAVAAMAFALLAPEEKGLVDGAVDWLLEHGNEDGGWGDSPESPSNLTAVVLVRAALWATERRDDVVTEALARSEAWLRGRAGGAAGADLVTAILGAYGSDRTFSTPILTAAILSGMLPDTEATWRAVPSLPFEAALLPRGLYGVLRLPVVSYAMPALIAVGLAHAVHAPSPNPLLRALRRWAAAPALERLAALQPVHGGFLEAAPLTAFVAICLGRSGQRNHPVVEKALAFLSDTVRDDGAWPIDTDLACWLTSLAADALAGSSRLDDPDALARRIRACQHRTAHVYTGAAPGGWSWTDRPGGVPDGDDTAGALVALARLETGPADEGIVAGLRWLLTLRNRDGGLPTFCRGWGHLPFDRSCPDISAHGLRAFALWRPRVDEALGRELDGAMEGLLAYLARSRDGDGAWTPLWFGDQAVPGKRNRVYGTAAVLEGLAALPEERVAALVEPARRWLLRAGNGDGGWGGDEGAPSNFECSARALAALAPWPEARARCHAGAAFLCAALEAGAGRPAPSPIGLYFASLWYGERLYPLLFATKALSALRAAERGAAPPDRDSLPSRRGEDVHAT